MASVTTGEVREALVAAGFGEAIERPGTEVVVRAGFRAVARDSGVTVTYVAATADGPGPGALRWLAFERDMAGGYLWALARAGLKVTRSGEAVEVTGRSGPASFTARSCPGAGKPWTTGMGRPICPFCHRGPKGLGAPVPRRRNGQYQGVLPAHELRRN